MHMQDICVQCGVSLYTLRPRCVYTQGMVCILGQCCAYTPGRRRVILYTRWPWCIYAEEKICIRRTYTHYGVCICTCKTSVGSVKSVCIHSGHDAYTHRAWSVYMQDRICILGGHYVCIQRARSVYTQRMMGICKHDGYASVHIHMAYMCAHPGVILYIPATWWVYT